MNRFKLKQRSRSHIWRKRMKLCKWKDRWRVTEFVEASLLEKYLDEIRKDFINQPIEKIMLCGATSWNEKDVIDEDGIKYLVDSSKNI